MIQRYSKLVNGLSPWQIAILAALGYGAWAALVNREYGPVVSLRAGLVQGSYAFVSTALISYVARAVLQRWGYHQHIRYLAMLLSWLVMLSIPSLLHLWQHTPNWQQAMLPGVLFGSLYLWSYCQQLQPSKS
ncbi:MULTISPECIES: hypothetical protein [unclassified Agarivorans]|uniref:hypothetical protein n=1 Tax=unclassified Agarivorans TaxID=2636026 RepID=UPI003D7C81BD